MITLDLLPNPPYKQGTLDLCAVASFATAITPFVDPGGSTLLQKLLSELMTFGKQTGVPGSDDPSEYFHARGRYLFERFAKQNPHHSMCQWFEHLQDAGIGPTFTQVKASCCMTHNASREMWSDTLINSKSTACIGYGFVDASDKNAAHYLAAWHDGANFCIKDPGLDRVVDGKGPRLDLLVRTKGLGQDREIRDLWVTLIECRPAVTAREH